MYKVKKKKAILYFLEGTIDKNDESISTDGSFSGMKMLKWSNNREKNNIKHAGTEEKEQLPAQTHPHTPRLVIGSVATIGFQLNNHVNKRHMKTV